MSCTATADHSARCRVAHALQTSNLCVPFLANPLEPGGARHMVALTIMWRVRVRPSRSRARHTPGGRFARKGTRRIAACPNVQNDGFVALGRHATCATRQAAPNSNTISITCKQQSARPKTTVRTVLILAVLLCTTTDATSTPLPPLLGFNPSQQRNAHGHATLPQLTSGTPMPTGSRLDSRDQTPLRAFGVSIRPPRSRKS